MRYTTLAFLLAFIAGVSQAASAQDAVLPLIAPAVRTTHAGQAMVLAAVRAGARIVAVGEHGIILLSDDGGRTHRQARSVPVDVTLTSVSFIDALRGWAAGHAGVILHTDDGGETWRTQRTSAQEDRPLFAVHFFDARQGVAVGLWSLVLTTDDGGANWHTVRMPLPDGAKKADLNLFGLFSDTRGRLFVAAEKGMVLRTDDRGKTWTYLSTGYKGSLWAGTCTASGVLVVGGLRGSLFRSADDGSSWQRIDSHSTASITAMDASADKVVGVGLDGLTLVSADDGRTFTERTRLDRRQLTSVVLDERGHPVWYSRQGVVPPTDTGN